MIKWTIVLSLMALGVTYICGFLLELRHIHRLPEVGISTSSLTLALALALAPILTLALTLTLTLTPNPNQVHHLLKLATYSPTLFASALESPG